jgi:drug/metabolite transporter (DMT)-like permease
VFVVRLSSEFVLLAEQGVSSALPGMLNASVPLVTAVASAAILGRFPVRRVLVRLTIGLIGAGLVAFPTVHEGHSSVVSGPLSLAALSRSELG